MLLRANAKLNLGLKILGKRPDGYHEIDSIMQSISLHDSIKLDPIPKGIKIFCANPLIPTDQSNTVYKAALAFFEKTGIKQGVKIEIQKLVPHAAGLGGGSADAAAVLTGLNIMYKTLLSESDLRALGEGVGSDVPFCLIGGRGRVRGRGELVEPLPPLPLTWFILVTPQILISTAWVYRNFKPVTQSADNDLESVVLPNYPEIGELKKELLKLGCLKSQMSGSGSSVFGIVESEKKGIQILESIRKKHPQSYLVASVDKGVVVATS